MDDGNEFPSFPACSLVVPSNVFIFLTNGEKNSQLFIRTRNNSFETFTLVGLFMTIFHRIGSIRSFCIHLRTLRAMYFFYYLRRRFSSAEPGNRILEKEMEMHCIP